MRVSVKNPYAEVLYIWLYVCLQRRKEPLQFGVVVTLKEMNGVNRIDDFIKMCMARGWLVNQLDIENQLDVYAKAEEDIVFEQ